MWVKERLFKVSQFVPTLGLDEILGSSEILDSQILQLLLAMKPCSNMAT